MAANITTNMAVHDYHSRQWQTLEDSEHTLSDHNSGYMKLIQHYIMYKQQNQQTWAVLLISS